MELVDWNGRVPWLCDVVILAVCSAMYVVCTLWFWGHFAQNLGQ